MELPNDRLTPLEMVQPQHDDEIRASADVSIIYVPPAWYSERSDPVVEVRNESTGLVRVFPWHAVIEVVYKARRTADGN